MATRKLVSLSEELTKRVEDFRFESRINTEAEAIRRLLELGLDAVQAGAKPTNENTNA